MSADNYVSISWHDFRRLKEAVDFIDQKRWWEGTGGAFAELEVLRKKVIQLEGALKDIVEQDPVELALDPTWPQRIAGKALGRP